MRTSGEKIENNFARSGGQRPLTAIVFGKDMWPFLKPGEKIWMEPIEPAAIRVGDVVMVGRQYPMVTTRRVVKIFRPNGELTFLTKGDNGLFLNPLIPPRQVVGKVTHTARLDFTRRGWRRLGRVIAWISYNQGRLYNRLVHSRWIRLLPILQKKVWLFPAPKLRVRGHTLNGREIQIRSWTSEDVDSMARAWSTALPQYSTSPERLKEWLSPSRPLDPAGCLMATGGGDCLGWSFATPCPQKATQARGPKTGFLGVFTVTQEGYRRGADLVLFRSVLSWMKTKNVSRLVTGPFPIFNHSPGIDRTTRIIRWAEYGWRPCSSFWFLQVTSSTYRDYRGKNLPPNTEFRPWRAGDKAPFFLKENPPSQLLVALVSDRVVGYCRWLRSDQIMDYDDDKTGSIFALAGKGILPVERGYILNLFVDPLFRGKGVGHALFMQSCKAQFQVGIREIQGWASRPRFYGRFGYKALGQFLQMELRI